MLQHSGGLSFKVPRKDVHLSFEAAVHVLCELVGGVGGLGRLVLKDMGSKNRTILNIAPSVGVDKNVCGCICSVVVSAVVAPSILQLHCIAVFLHLNLSFAFLSPVYKY